MRLQKCDSRQRRQQKDDTKWVASVLRLLLSVQMDFLDTVTEGVQVSRQELGSGQYRWTVTFLDDGDDFELEDVVSRNYLNTTTGDLAEITSTKVCC